MTLHAPNRRPTGPTGLRGRGVADALAHALEPVVGGPLPVGLHAWDGSRAGPETGPAVLLRSPAALRRILWHPGELGAAQAYVTGELDVDGDLAEALDCVRRAGRERQLAGIRPTLGAAAALARAALLLRRVGALGGPPPAPASQARLSGRLHSLGRDRQAISHHYDVTSDFYALLLDPHLAYSCAYWTSDAPGYTLEDAQRDKLELVCQKVGLRPGSRLLDIGCGWGSLSLYAAEHHGVRVTGVTIASEQKERVERLVAERGLGDLVEVRLQDYREIADDGYDAVVSLEMGEHVGAANYPAFASVLASRVRPGGRVLVQQMSRAGRHPGGGPFIESFIAPDMHMRPLGETVALLERSGLEVRDVEALREHYVRTVRAWLETLEARWDEAVALVGEESARVWRLYLVGGAMAFRDGRMGVDQVLMVRPSADGSTWMPPVRGGHAEGARR
ncbi:MAG TPA: cyclopropane-fatty-acyl-phospholipid synthase family protein [Dermatophilaceae bacterium]|nr:cyclopropane-fatty-acyl-phospholipid synthase family protein [Dermatophilaceae bacterium]